LKRLYNLPLLLAVCLGLTPWLFLPHAAADDGPSLESLSEIYVDRIERIGLEVRNETVRRTTILSQLDDVINTITGLENERKVAVNHSPKVNETLQQINTQLKTVNKEIVHNEFLLQQVKNKLNQLARPSIWQAALGKTQPLLQNKRLATQHYLVHTTGKYQRNLEIQQQKLSKQQENIVAYGRGITDSVQTLELHTSDLLEKRKHLEHQLISISSEIVLKQDRLAKLTHQSQQLLSNPQALQFAKRKKHLPDPVEGTLIRRFNEPKAKGLLKWKGILVAAPLGLPFTAVADGLVVFADQIQGLGNVAILDHGQGYMSLYGMAELLMVEEGQLLLTGDPVGTIGESVGANTSALYFEIRHNADTLDPQQWLQQHRISQKKEL